MEIEKKNPDRIEIKIHTKGLKEKFKELSKKNKTTMSKILEKEIIKYVQEKG